MGRKVAASTTGCWSCGTARRSRALRKEKVGLCRQLMTSPPLELTNTPTADNTRGTLSFAGGNTAPDRCQIWNKTANCRLKRSGTLRASIFQTDVLRFSRRGESCFIDLKKKDFKLNQC